MKDFTWSDGSGKIYLDFTQTQVDACSHSGECYHDCLYASQEIQDQLDAIDKQDKIDVLMETGAWDETDLQDDEETNIKLVWIACNDVSEDPDFYKAIE